MSAIEKIAAWRRIVAWRLEGDNAPIRELMRDAILHVQWLKERGRLP